VKFKFLLLSLLIFTHAIHADDSYRPPIEVSLSHSKAEKLGFTINEYSQRNGDFVLRVNIPKIIKNGEIYEKVYGSEGGIFKDRKYLGSAVNIMKKNNIVATFNPHAQIPDDYVSISVDPVSSIAITVDPKVITTIKTYIYYQYYDGLESPINLRYEIKSKTKK
jgi:hypothetical protein